MRFILGLTAIAAVSMAQITTSNAGLVKPVKGIDVIVKKGGPTSRQGQRKDKHEYKGTVSIVKRERGRNVVTSTRDPASGLATGKRQHKPFTFVRN